VTLIYKICPAPLWRQAECTGVFTGAPVDVADGFIHFSSAAQAAETAARHFAGQDDLVLVAFDDGVLGPALRWEPSRGGALFPHLYGELPVTAAHAILPLPLGPDGAHVFPDLAAEASRPFAPAAAGWIEVARDKGLISLVGPFWQRSDPPHRFYGLVAGERHLNSQGVMHGGMIMTFADHTLAMASVAASGGRRQATIQLDTQFVDGVRAGDFLVADCRVVRQSRSLMFMTGTFSVGTRTVALSSGVWKLRSA
jgi:uncharacterized protein (TIGR00369 family)